MRTLAVADPARLDTTIATFAASGDDSRRELAVLIGQRIDEPDRQRLDIAPPDELVELLGSAGLTPAAIVSVMSAERVEADTVARLLPTVGVPVADSIRVLHEQWDLPNAAAAAALGATAAEMRDAGCTGTEVMAATVLNVSRPTMVKLIDDGVLPSRKVGFAPSRHARRSARVPRRHSGPSSRARSDVPRRRRARALRLSTRSTLVVVLDADVLVSILSCDLLLSAFDQASTVRWSPRQSSMRPNPTWSTASPTSTG